MSWTLFLAGASGAIGRRLIPILIADGWRVVGMTRSAGKTELLTELGTVLYGPGTGFARPFGRAPLHVDAAAKAAALAVTSGNPGIYNFAEDDGEVTSAKARRQFDWSPEWRWNGR